MNTIPQKIILHKASRNVELWFQGKAYYLEAEFLRVHSPSAEVQGHGPGQKQVPLNKSKVGLNSIEAQGNYAIKLIFDDGHDSGIYTWPLLYKLATQKEEYWQQYLIDAEQEKQKRKGESVVKWV